MSNPRRRNCKACKEIIRNGQPAVMVANHDGMSHRLRYWLCRNCADQIDDALRLITTTKSGRHD